MNPNDANPESADQGRIGRVFVSSFILGLTLFGIMVASREQGVLFFYGVAAFLCYAFLSSFLIAWIAGRLFRQHEVREFKFDMANMILIFNLPCPSPLQTRYGRFFKWSLMSGQVMPELGCL